MKKRVLSVILGAALVSTALAGCGNTAKETAATTAATETAATAATETAAADASAYEECTITFDWWGGDSRHEATQAAVNAFMAKYPGINVEVNFGAWSDWETAKAAEYVSGNNPDLQQTNFDWNTKYNADGKTYLDLNTVSDVLDLTQFSDNDLKIVQDVNGGIAGIPVALTGRTFYWNKATFEQAGLEVPTTLEEFMAAGPVFKEKLGDKYYPLVIGNYDRAILMTYYMQAQAGTPIIDENGKLNFTQEQFKEGLDWIQSLEDNHVIPTLEYYNGEGADSIDKSARFINGEYAGIFEWDSAAKKYISALGDNGANLVVGAPFADMGPAGTGSFTKVSLMFSISAKSEHPHEAAMLLNYLLNDPEGVALMGTERGIPESKIAYETLDAAGAINETIAAAHDAVMNSKPMYWNPLFDDSSLKGSSPAAYTDIFDQFSYGMIDSDAAAQALFDAYSAVCN